MSWDDYEGPTFFYISVAILILLLIFAHAMQQVYADFYQNNNVIYNEFQSSYFIMGCCIFAFLMYLTSLICFLVANIAFHVIEDYSHPAWDSGQLGAFTCWGLGYLGMYLVWISRLRQCARLTRRDFHPGVKGLLVVLVLVFCISVLCFNIEYFGGKSTEIDLVAVLIFGFLSNLVFSITVVFLFVHRLFQTIVGRGEELLSGDINEERVSTILHDGDLEMTNKDLRLIQLMTRYAILSFVSILSSFICMVVWGVFFDGAGPDTESFTMFVWLLIPTDIIINSLCIYMSMPFATTLYQKVFCCYAHRALEFTLLKFTMRELQNQKYAHHVPSILTPEAEHAPNTGDTLDDL